MSDYAKLVEDLKRGFGHWYVEDWSRLVSMYADAAAAIEELQAELPKRGKWILSKERMRPDMCSVCGCVYEADRFMDKIAWNYCPNCGAKMEVQE